MDKRHVFVERLGTRYYVWAALNGRQCEVHRTRSIRAAHKHMRKAADLIAFAVRGTTKIMTGASQIDILT